MGPRVRSACADNLSLKMLALGMLRPGAACSDIYAAVVKEAAKRGIPLAGASGIGHGVGRGEIEGPYLAADDPTVLCENMVIALDVATLGPEGELLRSIDIYAVEKDGPRLLSWHRNWDKPYMITGFRSAH